MMLATGTNIYFTFLNKSLTFVVFGFMRTSHWVGTEKTGAEQKIHRFKADIYKVLI